MRKFLNILGFLIVLAVSAWAVWLLSYEKITAGRGAVIIFCGIAVGLVVSNFPDITKLTIGISKVGNIGIEIAKKVKFVQTKAKEIGEIAERLGKIEEGFQEFAKATVAYAYYSMATPQDLTKSLVVSVRRMRSLLKIAEYAYPDGVERNQWIKRLSDEIERLNTANGET